MIYTFSFFIEIVSVISAIFLFGSFILQTILFDRLICYQYQNHRNEWEKTGKPDGYNWKSPETKIWQRLFRRPDFVAEMWLREKPKWIKNNLKASKLYNNYLYSIYLLYVSLACFIITIATLKILGETVL